MSDDKFISLEDLPEKMGQLLERAEAAEARIAELGAALERIAGKNDMEGVADDLLHSAMANALYESELIARQTLASEGTAVREAERAVVEAALYAREMDWLHDTAALEKACDNLAKARKEVGGD